MISLCCSMESESDTMTTASNYQSVAKALGPDSGFSWKSPDIEQVESDSNNIDFKVEWDLFISIVQRAVAGTSTANDDLDAKLPAIVAESMINTAESVFVYGTPSVAAESAANAVYGRAVAPPPSNPTTPTSDHGQPVAAIEENVQTLSSEYVWKHHYSDIISNPGTENAFKRRLFKALRDSLRGFIQPIAGNENRNLIILQGNLNVGFGMEVPRTKLGFTATYALSNGSKNDHGCYVFGQSGEVYDRTAAVELKLDKTSCDYFVYSEGNKKILSPEFGSGHGPMGQAIFYSLDVWHCLARRGLSVKTVPVVILAGTKEIEEPKPKKEKLDVTPEFTNKNKICCLEAHLCIPEYCGQGFIYSIDRLISFNGTTGLKSGGILSVESAVVFRNSRDQRAMAIYIRTMRVGLELAIEIARNLSGSEDINSPVSLCCQQLLPTDHMATLIASPIPYRNSFQGVSLSIKQGELFQLNTPTIEAFAGFSNVKWYVETKNDVKLPKSCLVKVSSAPVHNTLVYHKDSDEALTLLLGASIYLKKELTQVLLGFCHFGRNGCLMTIMKDLREGEKMFQILEHQKYRQDGKLSQLWSAFCALVNALLLPLADVNVVHLDIRSTETFTYNILVTASNDVVELRLIDYDSLVFADSTSGIEQDDAIFLGEFKDQPACRYLLWQVLWIAFRWHTPQSSYGALETNIGPEKLTTSIFYCRFLDDDLFLDFKRWIGTEPFESLKKTLKAKTITTKSITDVLSTLAKAFNGKS